jgi:hypothetical protein
VRSLLECSEVLGILLKTQADRFIDEFRNGLVCLGSLQAQCTMYGRVEIDCGPSQGSFHDSSIAS